MRALTLLCVLGLLALLPAGCALSTGPELDGGVGLRLGPGEEVLFRADRAEYRQGDTARVVLRNDTRRALHYNLCVSARELRTEGKWARYDPLRLCVDALFELAPGAEAELREPITAEWQPGEYRMVTRVHAAEGNADGEVFTPTFTVRR